MAKYRHRIFEMYEFRDEATRALTPRSARPVKEASDPELWSFKYLAVSLSGSVTLVQFQATQDFGEETEKDLRDELSQLTDRLVNDSQVLFDFTGVISFSSASIEMLTLMDRQLRNKGSRMALCCLRAAVRETFFGKTNGRETRD